MSIIFNAISCHWKPVLFAIVFPPINLKLRALVTADLHCNFANSSCLFLAIDDKYLKKRLKDIYKTIAQLFS